MPLAKMKARPMSPKTNPEQAPSGHAAEQLQDLSAPNLRLLPHPERPLAKMKARLRTEKKS